MPRSKRDRVITLSQTSKKGKSLKSKIINDVRDAIDQYKQVYIISVQNERNQLLKDLREACSESKVFFGKNKVIQVALGRTMESQYRPECYKLSKELHGRRGLWFTNKTVDEVRADFEAVACSSFARAGSIADKTVTLPVGPLEGLPFSLEPLLRQLGLNTSLERGVIHLREETVLCKEGATLSPETCRILKLLDMKAAMFKAQVHACWSNDCFEVYD